MPHLLHLTRVFSLQWKLFGLFSLRIGQWLLSDLISSGTIFRSHALLGRFNVFIFGRTYRWSTWSFSDNFRISEKSWNFDSKFHQRFLFILFWLCWLNIINVSTVLQPWIKYSWCQYQTEDTYISTSTFDTYIDFCDLFNTTTGAYLTNRCLLWQSC